MIRKTSSKKAAHRNPRPARGSIPVALTIAGSDSGGGAGIQADLKTFAALGTHGTSAITCLTAQNPRGVTGIQAARPGIVRAQIEAIFAELRPAAVKTGMLFSTPIIQAVIEACLALDCGRTPKRSAPATGRVGSKPGGAKSGSGRAGRVPLVVDPVMVATSGARLLKPSAIRLMRDGLLPLATLVTPNLEEAGILAGMTLRTEEDLRDAARKIHEAQGCAVLVKGGHLRGAKQAVDVFYDGSTELLLSAAFVRGVSTHGTGCTCSAAITALLARGISLPEAVAQAKEFITGAIAESQRTRRHDVLNPFFANRA